MHYHIILTEYCNSQCKYCYEKSMKEFDNGLDKKFKFDFSEKEKFDLDLLKDLRNFIQKDKNPVIIFYGGEPLLEIKTIEKIIDSFNNTKVKFRMQTNGKLLNETPIKYLKKIDKILVSLDGTKERTNYNRGKGTYELVMKNIEKIKEQGYKGEIIARMTISQEFPDIYEQVLSLIKSGFSSIHWQIDAGFYTFDFNKEKFKNFTKNYNNSIKKLIDFWIREMKKGNVLKIYPFLGIIESILKNQKTKLRCGAGYEGYAITQSGKIIACPIMTCIKDFEAGSIKSSSPNTLKKFEIKGKCLNCSYLDLCGGRCLYWNYSNLWPDEGDEMICETIKFLIDNLKNKENEIKSLIKNKTIKLKDFNYEKYFGPEIIP